MCIYMLTLVYVDVGRRVHLYQESKHIVHVHSESSTVKCCSIWFVTLRPSSPLAGHALGISLSLSLSTRSTYRPPTSCTAACHSPPGPRRPPGCAPPRRFSQPPGWPKSPWPRYSWHIQISLSWRREDEDEKRGEKSDLAKGWVNTDRTIECSNSSYPTDRWRHRRASGTWKRAPGAGRRQ